MSYPVRKSYERLLERCLEFAVNCLFYGNANEQSVAKRISYLKQTVFAAKLLAFAKVVRNLFPQEKKAAHGAIPQLKCALLSFHFCQKKSRPHSCCLDVTVRTDTINKKC